MRKRILRVKNAVRSRMRILGSAVKYLLCCLLPRLNKTETWVICERGTDARDNGYAFYRYMVDHHPEIRLYYLITPDSADYPKVMEHAVAFGSLKNYRVVAKADKIISTHCYTALPVKHEKSWRLLGLAKRFYFLQHGIIYNKLPYLFGDKTGMRLFCCGAKPEYEYVRAHFLHPDDVVQCTGLARYDLLLPYTAKRQILVMPTWRRYLKDEKTFPDSQYFRAWNAVLRDTRLTRFLADTQTKLIFYPHYELQPWLKYFQPESSDVVLADFANYDVQQLLKESLLLVTDYSSVHFDFAYMEKPCLYYQFDTEQYRRMHYREGYFRIERDGFGPVEQEHERLVDRILESAGNGFAMDSVYRMRMQAFFAYRDQHNCERIYQAIADCGLTGKI